MFDSSVPFHISCIKFDNYGRELFTRYNNDHMTLLYIYCRYFDIFVPVSCLRLISWYGVAVLLKVISGFMSWLNN